MLMLIPFFMRKWILTYFYLHVLYEFFLWLTSFSDRYVPPPKGRFLLRFSNFVIVVLPHTTVAALFPYVFLDYFRQSVAICPHFTFLYYCIFLSTFSYNTLMTVFGARGRLPQLPQSSTE